MRWLNRLGLAFLGAVTLALLVGFWLFDSESGANWLLARAQSASDGSLSFESARGTLLSGLQLSDVSWSSEAVDITMDDVALAATLDPFPLQLNLSNVVLNNGSVQLPSAAAEAGDTQPFDIRQLFNSLVLPLRLSVDELRVRNVEVIRGSERLANVETLSLRAHWYEQLQVEAFDLQSDTLTASGAANIGFVDQQALRMTANVSGSGFDEHTIELAGTARDYGYEFSHVAIDGVVAEVAGSVLLDWEAALDLSAQVSVSRFDLHSAVESWPGTHPLTGELTFSFSDNVVDVSSARVRVANSPATAEGAGSINIATAALQGSLRWADMQWPIDSVAPNIESRSAAINLAGSLDQWTVDGDIDVATPSTPQGAFSIDASGDREHAEVAIISGAIVGGTVSGDVAYRWVGEQAWTANLDVRQIMIGEFLPEWPGVVSGNVVASGLADKKQASIRLSDVVGNLREKPLRASGGLSIAPATVIAENLSVVFGDSTALLSGAPNSGAGLSYDVQVSNLSEFLDDASGAFHARGNFREVQQAARLAIDLDSDQLVFADVTLTDVRVRNVDNADADSLLHVNAELGQASMAGQEIEAINLTTKISKTAQNAELRFHVRDAEAQFAVAGALDDWQKGFDSVWRGQLTSLSLATTEQHSLDLDGVAQLAFGKDHVAVQTVCLSGTLGARLCGKGEWRAGGNSIGDVELKGLPLSLVNQFIATGLQLDQLLSGGLEWSLQAQSGLSANGNLSLTEGRLQSLRSAKLSIATGPGTADFDISNGKLLSGSLDLPLPGNGEITGDFAIADVAAAARSDINGKLHVAISDISVLSHFTALMDAATGNLQAELALGGTVAAPSVIGDVRLINGELEYLPIGLDLRDINLQATMSADRNSKLQGSFRAGQGVGEIDSQASYRQDDALALEFSIKGEGLTLIDVPDLSAVVDTDLQVAYTPNKLTLGGDITVGEARVRPTNLVNSSVSTSEDVVIVAGELPEFDVEKSREEALKIFGELDVALGDEVTIDVSVARARASGSANFKWTGERMPIASGRYDLRGQVQAYGQVLDITEGRVRFSDGPADNPYLRIRAEREIFGNTQVKKAGVFIDGDARSPRIETYTTPLTTEERALTLLATGSDFDYEQGVGAVDFGTYIAPRLFIAYGVSLFGRDNVISARYDLSKGFGIKATSGNTESGVDLNYHFEN